MGLFKSDPPAVNFPEPADTSGMEAILASNAEFGQAAFAETMAFQRQQWSEQKQLIESSTVPIDLSLTYCHYSLNDTTLLSSDYWDLLQDKGIGVINASAVSMGLLTKRGEA